MSYPEDLASKKSLMITLLVFGLTAVAAILTVTLQDGERGRSRDVKRPDSRTGYSKSIRR